MIKKLVHWVFLGGLRFNFLQDCLLLQISFFLNVSLPNQQACCILKQFVDGYPSVIVLCRAKVEICYQKSEYLRKYSIKRSYLQTQSHGTHFRTVITPSTTADLVAQEHFMMIHQEYWYKNLLCPSSS